MFDSSRDLMDCAAIASTSNTFKPLSPRVPILDSHNVSFLRNNFSKSPLFLTGISYKCSHIKAKGTR